MSIDNYNFIQNTISNITIDNIKNNIDLEYELYIEQKFIDFKNNHLNYNNKVNSIIKQFNRVEDIGYEKVKYYGITKDENGIDIPIKKLNQYTYHINYNQVNNYIIINKHIRLVKKFNRDNIEKLIIERNKVGNIGFDCIKCLKMFDDSKSYYQHCNSLSHKKRVYGFDTIDNKYCNLCKVKCNNTYSHIKTFHHTILYLFNYLLVIDDQQEKYKTLFYELFKIDDIYNINFSDNKNKYNLIKFIEIIKQNLGDIGIIFSNINSRIFYNFVHNKNFVSYNKNCYISIDENNINIPYKFKYMFENTITKNKNNKFDFLEFINYSNIYITKFYDDINNGIKKLVNKEYELK